MTRITVIALKEDQLRSAGVRIRYLRLRPALEAQGHSIDIRFIDAMGLHERFDSEAYVFCKCHDARSIMLARAIRAAGRPVGVDIFDDYFSQEDDARLVHLRRWLAQIRPSLDFALCGTAAMAARLAGLLPGVRVHILNDPSAPMDAESVARAVERKAARARETSTVEVGWFGMGDNAYFPVGLDDLAAWGGMLAEVRGAGLVPRLSVLTNLRALTSLRLEALARLPVPVHLEEWTLEREAALLDRILVSFLPVNAQPFSTVKSPNRAVTSLVGGAQVLTAGFPLYQALGTFTYDSVRDLVEDLRADRLRLRRDTLPLLAAELAEGGTPEGQAAALVATVTELGEALAPGGAAPAPGAVIHGITISEAVHKYAQRAGWLSVASPFAESKLNYDIRFERDANGELWAVMSRRACGLLGADLRPGLSAPIPLANGKVLVHRLSLGRTALPGLGVRLLAARIAAYPAAIAATRALVQRLLPGLEAILSETTSPFAESGAGSGPGPSWGPEPILMPPPVPVPAPVPAMAP